MRADDVIITTVTRQQAAAVVADQTDLSASLCSPPTIGHGNTADARNPGPALQRMRVRRGSEYFSDLDLGFCLFEELGGSLGMPIPESIGLD